MRKKSIANARLGFTRVDALVGLSLLAILIGLLAPALLELQYASGQQRRSFQRYSPRPSSSWRYNSSYRPGSGYYDRRTPDYSLPYVPPYQPSPPIDYYYAAIAYSVETGTWGYAYDHSSRAAAESSALSRCAAPDAAVMVWTRNACCALAVGDNKKHGWGWHSNRSTAERIALEECRSRTTNCRIVCWTCTGR